MKYGHTLLHVHLPSCHYVFLPRSICTSSSKLYMENSESNHNNQWFPDAEFATAYFKVI